MSEREDAEVKASGVDGSKDLKTHPALVRLSRAEQGLVLAKDLPEIKRIIDIAEAARVYAKAAKLGEGAARHAEEIKLKAQRKAGECLARLEKKPGARTDLTLAQADPRSSAYCRALEDAEIARPSAKRWQQVASIPPAEFSAYLSQEPEKELSTSGLLAYRKSLLKEAEIQGAREAIARQIQNAPVQGYLLGADCEVLRQKITDGADLLLTDPPYLTEVPDIRAHAAAVASWIRILKPTGRAYIFTGSYPAELLAYLKALEAICGETGFTLANVLVWTYRNTLGPAPTKDYKPNWQACLYLRGPEAPPLDCPLMTEQFSVHDLNAPDGRIGGRYHAWEKPQELAERFIRHSTKPADLVVDPYAGTGTFVLASLRLGRRAIGAEKDPAMLEICRQRGLEVRSAG